MAQPNCRRRDPDIEHDRRRERRPLRLDENSHVGRRRRQHERPEAGLERDSSLMPNEFVVENPRDAAGVEGQAGDDLQIEPDDQEVAACSHIVVGSKRSSAEVRHLP